MSEPIFSPEGKEKTKQYCLICKDVIEKREKKVQLGKKGWDNFKQVSEEWSCLKIPETERFHNYPRVHKQYRSFKLWLEV